MVKDPTEALLAIAECTTLQELTYLWQTDLGKTAWVETRVVKYYQKRKASLKRNS